MTCQAANIMQPDQQSRTSQTWYWSCRCHHCGTTWPYGSSVNTPSSVLQGIRTYVLL